MKKLLYLAFALIAIFSFNACNDDDGFTFIARQDPDGLMFTNSPAGTYTLSLANGNNLAERFVWNPVDFGVQTPVNYELQGAIDTTFNNLSIIPAGTSSNVAVRVNDMLDLAEEAGLDNNPETENSNTGTVYFRVRAYVGSDGGNVVEQYSDTLAVNVMLPEATGEPEKMNLYLVGDATAAGWNNNNNNMPLFRSADNENNYHFEGRFAGGAGVEGFKLLEMLGEWQPQWGLSNGELSNSTILSNDPDAFRVANDSYYSLTVNTEDMTYSFEELNASGAATYQSMGIIGPSTPGGWDSGTNLTQSSFDPHIWYLNNIELGEGELKFRANGQWENSWGAASFPEGQGANNNDPNITVSPGTYNIWFNDLSGRYLFIPVAE